MGAGMAQIQLKPITKEQAAGRGVFVGGMSGLGAGGNDYLCGHCGAVILADFDLHVLVGDYVFQCRACSGLNERPSP
jgi:hypothetical protein